MAKAEVYEGPRTYVSHDQVGPHGELLEGGWHYSVVVDEDAKQIALDAAQAHVKLWEKRGKKAGLKKFAATKIAEAQEAIALIENAGFDVPDRKLSLDSETGVYTFAVEGDLSHKEKHHEKLVILAPGGNIGAPHDEESIEATKRHLETKLERIASEGLHPHEIKGKHVLTTPVEISAAIKWLETL